MTSTRARKRWSVIAPIAIILLLLLAAVAWVGIRALMAKDQLGEASAQVDGLRQALTDQDLAKVETIANDAGPHVAKAASLTSDPIWRLVEFTPVLGANLTATRVVSSELDALINELALPLAQQIPKVGAGTGRIDVQALERIADAVARTDATLQAGQRDLARVDVDALNPAVANGVQQIEPITEQVTPVVHDLAPFLHIAPALVGAHGPRDILLVVQNNAELRTAGGISGSFVELTAVDGKISLKKVASDSAFPTPKSPVAQVPTSTTELYGNVVGTHVQNITMPADFQVSADLASAWWKGYTHRTPDEVIAIDPVVLASLMRATGPVSVRGVTIDADNVVQRLLVDVYRYLPEDEQDPFFEAVSTAVFAKLTSGSSDPLALVGALQQPLADGRISAWSGDRAEQKVLGSGVVGGPAARQHTAGKDAYAVYLNDSTGSKMDPYVKTSIIAKAGACRADGRAEVAVSVTLRSTAPADAATALPGPVTGWGLNGTAAGDIRTIVSVAAPPKSFYGGVTVQGKQTPSPDVTDAGFPTSAASVLLKPGQSKTVVFRFISAHTGSVNPSILHTPMMTEPKVSASAVRCG